MRLTKLTMKNFAPFADGEVDFPSVNGAEGLAEVHLFTGENGTGKTRVLAALMGALGNLNPLQDRVRQDSGAEIEVFGKGSGKTILSSLEGSWAYRKGTEDLKKPSFPIQRDDAFALAGTGIALLEDTKVSAGAEIKAARIHESLNLNGPVGGSGILQRLMNMRMQVALERDANSSATPGRMTECLTRLEKAIANITGRPFSILVKPGREIRLMAKWGDVELFFSELPDGLRSLLNWLAGWVILQAEHYYSSAYPLNDNVILILDEPENHLHPAWQRRVLPAVQKLFPKAQIFVVTHSPFVVSSLNEGWIHKFTRSPQGEVQIEPAKEASRGDSYMTAVQDILDLSEWFDPDTEKELAEFDHLLDKAYANNGSSVEAMRAKANKLAKRSLEVTNLVMGMVAQFDRTAAATKESARDR
jgi:energy-coupling factor transporter ATP-binding protein EcfA2